MNGRRSSTTAIAARPPSGRQRVAPGEATAEAGTATRILDAAERLAQDRGFNAFSYADIAAELALTKPALHYHFPNKADLGTALITRYTTRFAAALAAIEAGHGPGRAKLDGYIGLYLEVLRDQRMCLCGMLAAEYQTLPDPMRVAVLEFFDRNETWLTRVLDEGSRDGSLHCPGSVRDSARTIIGSLEGAMLVARPYGDINRFLTVADQLLAALTPAPHAGLSRA